MFKFNWIAGLLACLLGCMNHSCKTTKPLTPDHIDRISFGSYGGFAGSYKEFVLVPNGQVFIKKRFGANYEEVQSIEQNQTSQFFNTVQTFHDNGLMQNQSGNLTNFIKYYSGGKEMSEWYWPAGIDIDSRIEILFKNLRTVCKESAPVM